MDWRGDPEGERLRGSHLIIFGTRLSFMLFTLALRQGLRASYFLTSREVRLEDAAAVGLVAQEEKGFVQGATTVVVGTCTRPKRTAPPAASSRWHWIVNEQDPICPRASGRGYWHVSPTPTVHLCGP